MKDLIGEERQYEAAPEDWPVARQIRWRLLHGETLTNSQVIDDYGGSPTRLIMAVNYLEENGVAVDRPRRDGETHYLLAPTVRRRPRPPVEGNGQRPAPDTIEFARPAPATPMLGTVLRVVMVAEEDGNPVAVLADIDGARWFAHLEQAPPLST